MEDGNGVVFINLNKCIFESSVKGEFPGIYSIVPVVQGEFRLTVEENEVDIAKIAPDKSPFWLSVAHELIHVLRKLSDPNGSSNRLRSTPQNVINSANKRSLYPEFRVPRLSYKLWTNEEERETVVGEDISELRLRQESGQKIRYIYQSAGKVFFESMDIIRKICGGEPNIPIITPSYEGGFDFSLTPLPILASMFDKKHLLECLVTSLDYISATIGKSVLDLKKLGFLPDITADSGSVIKNRIRKLGKLIGCAAPCMPLVSGMNDEFGPDEHNYSVRSVSHGGDCGYMALGISRQGLAERLQKYLHEHASANDPIRRELLWQLEHMPQQDKVALAKLGGVEIENYIEYFIRLSADEFRENSVILDHNVGGVINTWVNYLDLGDGVVPGSREEQHGLGTIIATLLQRPITVLVQGDVGRYTETFTPLSGVVITELLETTRGESGSIGLFCREGDAHFDILFREDEK